MRAPGRLGSAPARVARPVKVALPFYKTLEWTQLCKAIEAERGKRCEQCAKTGVRMFRDHVIELKDGGAALDKRNIRQLCGRCHSIKTAASKRARVGLA